MLELSLAIAHHVLVFGLAAMLAVEAAWTQTGMTGAQATRVARLDAGYGATAGLVIFIGIARLIWGAKGWLYFVGNPWFWAKMASFTAIGLLSIPPTLRFLAWRKHLRTDPDFAPPADQVAAVRRYQRLQLLLVLPVLAFAAAMARYAR